MKNSYIIFVILFSLLAMGACSKDETESSEPVYGYGYCWEHMIASDNGSVTYESPVASSIEVPAEGGCLSFRISDDAERVTYAGSRMGERIGVTSFEFNVTGCLTLPNSEQTLLQNLDMVTTASLNEWVADVSEVRDNGAYVKTAYVEFEAGDNSDFTIDVAPNLSGQERLIVFRFKDHSGLDSPFFLLIIQPAKNMQ